MHRVRLITSSIQLLPRHGLRRTVEESTHWNWDRSLSTTTTSHTGSNANNANKLSGRTCMITGGSSGIGFAIAERFLHEGAKRIILVGRSYDRLADAARKLEPPALDSAPSGKETESETESARVATRAPEEDQQDQDQDLPVAPEPKPGALITSSDRISLLVGDVSGAAAWTRELESAMTNVDILINAAGISISSVLAKSDPADISRVLRTNLEGALLTSRALIRASIRSRMKNRAAGATSSTPSGATPSKCIINISSLLALKGGTGAVPYAASKAGILGLTRSLTVEVAKSLRGGVVIRSNAIVPGYIETPMIGNFSQDEVSRLKDDIPLGRFGQPHEVADAAVFLAQNEYANNCVINLDGGLSAL